MAPEKTISPEQKRKDKVIQNERAVDLYVSCSFKKDFKMNNRDIEFFEAPKMLGDVFESLIGAIFIDGGIE